MTTEFRGQLLLQIDNYSSKQNNKQCGKRDGNCECEYFSKLNAMRNANTSQRRSDPNSISMSKSMLRFASKSMSQTDNDVQYRVRFKLHEGILEVHTLQ